MRKITVDRLLISLFLTSCLAVLFTGGDNDAYAQSVEYRNTYEAVIENNISKVLTTMVVYATTEEQAKSQIALNGWRVVEIRQLNKTTTQDTSLNPDSIATVIPDDYKLESAYTEVGGTKPPIDPATWFDQNSHLDLTPNSNDLDKLETIYFVTGSITPRQTNSLDRLKTLDKTKRYVVMGHADEQQVIAPTETYTDNFDLSYKRAEEIKREMVEIGIPAINIKTVGLGDRYPAVRTDTKDNPANRRAEVYGLRKGE